MNVGSAGAGVSLGDDVVATAGGAGVAEAGTAVAEAAAVAGEGETAGGAVAVAVAEAVGEGAANGPRANAAAPPIKTITATPTKIRQPMAQAHAGTPRRAAGAAGGKAALGGKAAGGA